MAEAWVRVRRVARAPHMLLLTAPVKAIDSAKAQESGIEFLPPSSPGAGRIGSGAVREVSRHCSSPSRARQRRPDLRHHGAQHIGAGDGHRGPWQQQGAGVRRAATDAASTVLGRLVRTAVFMFCARAERADIGHGEPRRAASRMERLGRHYLDM